LEWSGDGSTLYVACRDGHVRQIDPVRVEIIAEQPLFDSWAYSLAVHSNNRELVVGGGLGAIKRVTFEQ
jgi:hypothetical protein